ncbi:MAG: hypothetical protein KDC98_24730 [Planctomycetes bacterium]|nr:hypothetical protein [Planctomycetota bacterium]
MALLAAAAMAHASVTTAAQAAASPPPVTFAGLSQAVKVQDYAIVQLRRFFKAPGLVTVREELLVASNGTDSPDFELRFRGVEGEPPGSALWTLWAQNYNQRGTTFVEYGQFRIRDLVKVQLNYTLHDFGSNMRAGRLTRRVVVFPSRLDKAIWLLEVDAATLIPLYAAEYDAHLRLLSEVEAVSFVTGPQVVTAAASSTLISHFPDFASAAARMGNPTGLVEPKATMGEYSLSAVKVEVDPLNNRQKLVVEYTDGIDQFFVSEIPGVADAFGSLPLRQKGSLSDVISRFRDPTMTMLMFWDDSVFFQVAGNGSLLRLDAFAKAICTDAVLDR